MDKEKWIEGELERMKNTLSKNVDKLPRENLPFMEPHLMSLYYQSYLLLAHGFYNASIVLCAVFLESLTKERLFNDGITDEELEKMEFGPAISECEKRKLLSSKEISFLRNKKDKVRNPYLHYNQVNLTKGKYFDAYKVANPVEKLIELDKRVRKWDITEQEAQKELIQGLRPEPMDSTTFRPLAEIVKSQEDEKNAFEIFMESDIFIREFAKKYFQPKQTPQRPNRQTQFY